MSFDQMSSNDKAKLTDFIDSGVKVLQDVKDQQDGVKDLAKTLAEEFGVKPALLMKALRTAFKSTLEDDREQVDQVEAILVATGRS